MTEPIHPDPSRSALLIIDMQPDFMPGGALPVQAPHPAEIIAPVRAMMEAGTLPLQIATQDWHPPGHISFASRHDDKQPFDCCGLARDVCVKWTAEDAAAAGFTTRVIWDLTWPVDADNDAEVRDELGAAGVVLVDADQLLAR